MNRETHLKRIYRKLDSAFGSRAYEPPIGADLDCLWWQLEKFVGELEATLGSEEDPSQEEMRRFLWTVRLRLKHDFNSVFEDVIKDIDQTIGPDKNEL